MLTRRQIVGILPRRTVILPELRLFHLEQVNTCFSTFLQIQAILTEKSLNINLTSSCASAVVVVGSGGAACVLASRSPRICTRAARWLSSWSLSAES